MHYKIISRRRHTGSLRNACRSALLFSIALLSAGSAFSQSYPNGLSTDSVSPEEDAIFIKQMNARMDSIRRTQNRPTVALVLSGGGAKGAAEVGALKLLEEMQIPVDMVCGTSIGGLVGGFLALGYNSSQMDSLFRTRDWDKILSDRVDYKYIPYEKKLYKSMYQLYLPFHYEKDYYKKKILGNEEYGRRQKRSDLDVRSDNGRAIQGNLASSLPAGYAYGFNINNLLSSMSVGYQDSISFSTLPIPYLAVAGDMVSCKAKNFGSGHVKTAMRSTMSIPGLFSPVRYNDMILVDGGTRNNFPVDLARAMGADYVIGIELSDIHPSYNQINNVGNLLFQFITMLGIDSFGKNVDKCDVFIKPELSEFNMLSFSPENIDVMIERGYAAALEKKDQLENIKSFMSDAHTELQAKPATDINNTPVQISAVIFDGLSDKESKILMRTIKLKAGSYVTGEDIEEAMSKLQASGAFESVTYSLTGQEEPYRLIFSCTKGPVNRVGVGFRMDTEEWASLVIDLGLNTQKLRGSKLDFSAKLGTSQKASLRYSLDIPSIPTFNIEAKVTNMKATFYQPFTSEERNLASATSEFFTHSESVFLSNIRGTHMEFQGGIRLTSYIPNKIWTDDHSIWTRINNINQENHLSAIAKAELYSLDDHYYPTKGSSLTIGDSFDFLKFNQTNVKPANEFYIDYQEVIGIGKAFAIIPDIHLRIVNYLGDKTKLTGLLDYAYIGNYVGGDLAGRYVDHQIPFVGFNHCYMAKDITAVANLDLRLNPVGDLYISAKGGVILETPTLKDIASFNWTSHLGAALEIGYYSAIGPIRANVHWSDFTHSYEGYLSLGLNF